MKKIVIATRLSELAMYQATVVKNRLKSLFDVDPQLTIFDSKGDRDHRSFEDINETGIFTNEINTHVMNEIADIAVHSLKDLPALLDPSLEIAAVLKRGEVEDALISDKPLQDLHNELIGTSSIRRKSFLGYIKPDLRFTDIRGNVPTRINKYKHGEVNALVLALAGIRRLNVNIPYFVLDKHIFVPQANQGFIAVVTKSNSKHSKELFKMLSKIDDKNSRIVAELERSVMVFLKAGCHSPIGIYSWIESDKIFLHVSEIEKNGEYRRDLWLSERIKNRSKLIDKLEKSW